MNCSTILFVSNTMSVVAFYPIFAGLSRSSLKVGHDYHFYLKLDYQFHLNIRESLLFNNEQGRLDQKNEI